MPIYDLLIVGGGINGTGIAVDAAGRGLSVLLCEQGDLAQATSSASSKLIHGGLRYLEHYEFKLVHKALKERDVLLHAAPHLISPLRFVLPYAPHLRPVWLIRLGLFIYDRLGGKTRLPRSQHVQFSAPPLKGILKENFTQGFEYSDCWADDSRLVITNAITAQQSGANIAIRTKVIKSVRFADYWEVTTENRVTQEQTTHRAKLIVNAAGPWVSELLSNVFDPDQKSKMTLALIKGSHIIVPRLYEGSQAYLLQHTDDRVIFVIPFVDKFTLIGTTDIPYQGDPLTAKISKSEIDYLCDIVNHYFQHTIAIADIVHTYSGVRPLIDSGESTASELTRDYKLVFDRQPYQAPLLNIFGGKITTYRQLSEEAVNSLKPFFSHLKPAWTHNAVLAGGDIKNQDMSAFIKALQLQFPWLAENTLRRMALAYGTRIYELLGNAKSVDDLGQYFGADLYETEVNFVRNTEWALTADDILWRRSKLGLFLTTTQKDLLQIWLTSNPIKT